MALSLIDLLSLPLVERTRENIILNIPSLKRKCDLFYHLSDKEAYKLLKYCEVQQFSEDLVIPESDTHLCVLLRGKVSLCHKNVRVSANTAHLQQIAANINESQHVATPIVENDRRKTVIEVVTEFLAIRKATMESDKIELQQMNKMKAEKEGEDGDRKSPHENYYQYQMPTRQELYGKSVLQYTDGSYFGGPDMAHKQRAQHVDEYVYVADTTCLVVVISEEMQSTIINAHMLKSIEDKETVLRENHITRKLSKAQRSALLHEMVEENFIYGNTLVQSGNVCDTVYLIKSGFARITVVTKKPKCQLSLAIQHLPSTKLQQRQEEVLTVITDIGPGEFIGGFELLFDVKEYLFTLTAQTDILAYNIRAQHFKDVLLKEGSKTQSSLVEDFVRKFELRRSVSPLDVSPIVMKYVSLLLDGEPEKEFDPADLLVAEAPSPASSPNTVKYGATTKRTPNRGPFADRVRNRMIELGFKSRRGTT